MKTNKENIKRNNQDCDQYVPQINTLSEEPFGVFNVSHIGIDQKALQALFAPTYDDLEWDMYDVRKRQNEILLANFPNPTPELHLLCAAYYANAIYMEMLKPYIEILPFEQQLAIQQVEPFRQRAMASYLVKWHNEWHVERSTHQVFEMDVADGRRHARLFQPMSPKLSNAPLMHKLLRAVATMTRHVRRNVSRLRITAHQMRTTVTKGLKATNTPEGVHQDGADFIVSALVIARNNISGGASRIYATNRHSPLLKFTLQPGEGIFQADQGSSLWHDVSPIVTKSTAIGTRAILGFDIHIIQ